MAADVIVRLEEVQQWLEPTKVRMPELDLELAESAKVTTFAELSAFWDTSGWTDYTNTPDLVRKIISLRIACWFYARQYSEATAEVQNVYATWLCSRADALVQGLLSGSLELPNTPGSNPGGISFWPTDDTGSTQQYDASGQAVGSQYDEDIKFHMGTVF